MGNQSSQGLTLGAFRAQKPSYRFPIQQFSAWLEHLHAEGYVVLNGVLSQPDVENAKRLLWDDIEAAAPEGKQLLRSDARTWDAWRLSQSGLSANVAQGAGVWHVRGCKHVKQAFANIWGTSDLIVSMDCVIVSRPWWVNSFWRPETEGLHLDQNPFSKPGFECVQGMVPLLPVTCVTGGLQVVPGSHKEEAKKEQKAKYSHLQHRGDWCPLFDDNMKSQLLLAEAGDLILWDSRTIHGGLVGTGKIPQPTTCFKKRTEQPVELARLSVCVAMTPRAWASERVLNARIKGFQRGENFNHSPHEAGTSSGTVKGVRKRGLKPIELSEEQRALL